MRYIQNSILILTLLVLSGIAVLAQGLGNVKGRVSSVSGKRLSNVTVTARQDGKNLKTTKTNLAGRFRLNGLPAGKYNLVFEKPGFSGGVLYNILIKKKKTNNLEKKRIFLTVDEGTLVFIKGSVFDQSGKSVWGAKVVIREVSPKKGSRRKSTSYTDISGGFSFRFTEGTRKFRVTAKAKGVSASKDIEVSEAAIYRIALTLKLPTKKE